MSLMKKIPLEIYDDDKAILDIVAELKKQYPNQPYSQFEVPFDRHGNLLRDGYIQKNMWDYKTRSWIPTDNYEIKKQNETFVDAISFVEIEDYGIRKGRVLFEHLDGRKTYMSIKHFQNALPHMVKGKLIAKFRYIGYYNAWGLEVVEVLV